MSSILSNKEMEKELNTNLIEKKSNCYHGQTVAVRVRLISILAKTV